MASKLTGVGPGAAPIIPGSSALSEGRPNPPKEPPGTEAVPMSPEGARRAPAVHRGSMLREEPGRRQAHRPPSFGQLSRFRHSGRR